MTPLLIVVFVFAPPKNTFFSLSNHVKSLDKFNFPTATPALKSTVPDEVLLIVSLRLYLISPSNVFLLKIAYKVVSAMKVLSSDMKESDGFPSDPTSLNPTNS